MTKTSWKHTRKKDNKNTSEKRRKKVHGNTQINKEKNKIKTLREKLIRRKVHEDTKTYKEKWTYIQTLRKGRKKVNLNTTNYNKKGK